MWRLFPILNRIFPKSSARDFPLPPKVGLTPYVATGVTYIGGIATVIEKTPIEVVGPPSASGSPFNIRPEEKLKVLTPYFPVGVVIIGGSAGFAKRKPPLTVGVVIQGKFGLGGSAEWARFDKYEAIREQDDEELLWIA